MENKDVITINTGEEPKPVEIPRMPRGISKYMPHQGKREMARRVRQMNKNVSA